MTKNTSPQHWLVERNYVCQRQSIARKPVKSMALALISVGQLATMTTIGTAKHAGLREAMISWNTKVE